MISESTKRSRKFSKIIGELTNEKHKKFLDEIYTNLLNLEEDLDIEKVRKQNLIDILKFLKKDNVLTEEYYNKLPEECFTFRKEVFWKNL